MRVRETEAQVEAGDIEHKEAAAAIEVAAGQSAQGGPFAREGQVGAAERAAEEIDQRSGGERAELLAQAAAKGDGGAPEEDGGEAEGGVEITIRERTHSLASCLRAARLEDRTLFSSVVLGFGSADCSLDERCGQTKRWGI